MKPKKTRRRFHDILPPTFIRAPSVAISAAVEVIMPLAGELSLVTTG